jgi:hypothetical protein
MEVPVAQIFMSEVTEVLLKKISEKMRLWEGQIKMLDSRTIFVDGLCLWNNEDGKEWVMECYEKGILRKCECRLLFFEKRGNGYKCIAFYFSNGNFTKTSHIGPFDMFSIRGVDLEQWILSNLRKGLDPLENVAFNGWCEKHRLDFFPISEYAGAIEQQLVYTLAGLNGDKSEYEELEKQGKISQEYLDSARAYLKYQDILESVKE